MKAETPIPLNRTHWFEAEHQLGHAPFRPENVEYRSTGEVRLHLRGDLSSAAEIRTHEWRGAGSYGARLQCPDAPGSLCTFFLYEDALGRKSDEIDIEMFPGDENKVMYVVWVQGRKAHYVEEYLPFDPREGMHDYRINYAPGEVSIEIDGVRRATFREDLPTSKMRIMSSVWWPDWMTPSPRGDTFLTLQSVWYKAAH